MALVAAPLLKFSGDLVASTLQRALLCMQVVHSLEPRQLEHLGLHQQVGGPCSCCRSHTGCT